MTTDLSEIREALAKATQGDWACYPQEWRNTRPADCYDVEVDGLALAANLLHADAHLLANSPAWLAELCDRVERAEAQIDAAMRVVDPDPDPLGPGIVAMMRYQATAAANAEAAVERVRARCVFWSALFADAITEEGQTLRDAAREILKTLDGAK